MQLNININISKGASALMLPCQGLFGNAHQLALTGVPNLPLQS